MNRAFTLILLAVLLFPASVFGAVANDEILTQATKKYDEIVNDYKKLKGSGDENADEVADISREQYNAIKKKIDEAIDLFDQFIRVSTNEDGKKASRHYMVALKEYDFILKNDLKEFRSNYAAISGIEKELDVLKGYYYPINYKNDGKSYIIKFENRTAIEKTLYVEFTETCSNMGKSEDAARYGKKANSYYTLGDYNLWWTAHIWFYHDDKLYRQDADMVEAAEKVIYAMSGLKRSEINKIKDSNWVNYMHAYRKLNSLLASKPELSRGGEVWAQAGENFEKLDENKWALEYYNKAINAGYGDKNFLMKMMEKGKQKDDKTLVQNALNIYENKNLYTTYWCSDYQTIAGYYRYVGNTAKADELDAKYKTCVKDQDRKQRRAERGAKFYVSFAPLAPISGNYQGSIQIGGRKRLHEFGVKQTNVQKDYGFDVYDSKNSDLNFKWSGMGYYYTFKKFSASSSDIGFYYGFQLRYTDKKFETQRAMVQGVGYTNFNPTEKRYDLTFQFGYMLAGKLLHLEMYYGAGLGYSKFDGGSQYWTTGDNSKIITNHNILANRKESRIGATLRLGLVIGINFINK